MKKWIAPFLVLALAVLLIVCGKGITEKILERNADKTSFDMEIHLPQTIHFTADLTNSHGICEAIDGSTFFLF